MELHPLVWKVFLGLIPFEKVGFRNHVNFRSFFCSCSAAVVMLTFKSTIIFHDMICNCVDHEVDFDVIVVPFLSFRVFFVVNVPEDNDTIIEPNWEIILEKTVQCRR